MRLKLCRDEMKCLVRAIANNQNRSPGSGAEWRDDATQECAKTPLDLFRQTIG